MIVIVIKLGKGSLQKFQKEFSMTKIKNMLTVACSGVFRNKIFRRQVRVELLLILRF